MAQAPIQFDRASGALVGANAWERLAAVALVLGSKVASNFSHRGYNICANLLRTTLPASSASGRSTESRRVTAGKPRIAASSLIVPLSDSVQRACRWS